MIKERLSAVLNALEVTPDELAKAIGCTKKRAEKIIAGTATVYLSDACSICAYIGMDADSLFKNRRAVQA